MFGRVDSMANTMVDKLNIRKIMVGRMMAGSCLNRLTSAARPSEMMIPLSEISILDLLSAIELRFICVRAVSLSMESAPRE